MLWKLGRIDGDPVLRETRLWATWEYVSSVGGGQQGMVGLCAHSGCGKQRKFNGIRTLSIIYDVLK